MAITGLRWVQRGEWPDGGATILNSNNAEQQKQEDGGPWQTVELVFMNSAGQERPGGQFLPSGQ